MWSHVAYACTATEAGRHNTLGNWLLVQGSATNPVSTGTSARLGRVHSTACCASALGHHAVEPVFIFKPHFLSVLVLSHPVPIEAAVQLTCGISWAAHAARCKLVLRLTQVHLYQCLSVLT